jgi:hypothetical protein
VRVTIPAPCPEIWTVMCVYSRAAEYGPFANIPSRKKKFVPRSRSPSDMIPNLLWPLPLVAVTVLEFWEHLAWRWIS